MPPRKAQGPPEGLREGQKMKGPWGLVGARALAGAAPPTPAPPSCAAGVNKDFSRWGQEV